MGLFWRVLVGVGALTFLVGGLDILSSDCPSVDFGGNRRVLSYTCVPSGQGEFSGSLAGGGMLVIAALMFLFAFWPLIGPYLTGAGTTSPATTSGSRRPPGKDAAKVHYDFSEWSPRSVAALNSGLRLQSIPGKWAQGELVVHQRYEAAVDRLVANQMGIESPGDTDVELAGVDAVQDFESDDSGSEVGYSTASWSQSQFTEITTQLAERGITFFMEEGDLVVTKRSEPVTDRIIGDVTGGPSHSSAASDIDPSIGE